MDDMDDVLESGGCRWRTHSNCHCHCLVWRDEPPPNTTACHLVYFSVFFQKYPQSLFHFQHMTLSTGATVLPIRPWPPRCAASADRPLVVRILQELGLHG